MLRAWFLFWLLQGWLNPPAHPAPSALDKKQSIQLLRAAELHMAEVRRGYRPVRKLVIDEQTGDRYPNTDFQEDADSPLTDRACRLRLRFEEIQLFENDPGQNDGQLGPPITAHEALKKEIAPRYVLKCTIVARLEGLFGLAHVDSSAADSAFLAEHRSRRLEKEIRKLKNEVDSRAGPDDGPEIYYGRSGEPRPKARRRTPSARPCVLQVAPFFLIPTYSTAPDWGGSHVRFGGAGRSGSRCEREYRFELPNLSAPLFLPSVPDETTHSRRRRLHEAEQEHSSARDKLDEISDDFREGIEQARHTVLALFPMDHAPPERIPVHFDAVVWIRYVEWDRAADLPTLVIHADLLESQDLGVGDPIP